MLQQKKDCKGNQLKSRKLKMKVSAERSIIFKIWELNHVKVASSVPVLISAPVINQNMWFHAEILLSFSMD